MWLYESDTNAPSTCREPGGKHWLHSIRVDVIFSKVTHDYFRISNEDDRNFYMVQSHLWHFLQSYHKRYLWI